MADAFVVCDFPASGVTVPQGYQETFPFTYSGRTYQQIVTLGAAQGCQSDGNGNMAYLMVKGVGASDQPVLGGEMVGLDIGGAVLLAMAIAFGFRSLRRMLESSGES